MLQENKGILNSYDWEKNKDDAIKEQQTWREANTINETPLEASEGKAEGEIKNEGGNSIKREYDTSFTLPLIGLIFFFWWYIFAWMWGLLWVIVILALKWEDLDEERVVAIKEMINFFVSYSLWFLVSIILSILIVWVFALTFFAIVWFVFSIAWLISHLNNKSYVYPLSIDIMNARK